MEQRALTLTFPTLERLALVKTATSIWKYCNLQTIGKTVDDVWSDLTNIVTGKIEDLCLPSVLKRSLLQIATFIGSELLVWATNLSSDVREIGIEIDSIGLMDCLTCVEWKQHGKIDCRETARALSKLDGKLKFTLNDKYKIACMYFLKDEIETMWQQNRDEITVTSTSFWADVMNNKPISVNRKYMLLCSQFLGKNESGIEYVWSTLTHDEKMGFLQTNLCSLLLRYVRQLLLMQHHAANCLCSFILLLNEQQLGALFANLDAALVILMACIEDWVYVDLFVKVAERVREKLCQVKFPLLLIMLVKKIGKNNQDNRLKACFEDLWTKASPMLKQSFIDSEVEKNFLCTKMLKKLNDNRILGLVLEDMPVDVRNKFLLLTA